MRIFPIALIVIGLLGVAKYLGLIPVGMFHLIGPLLLIALGVALFFAARAVAAAIGAPATAVAAQTHRSHRPPGWFEAPLGPASKISWLLAAAPRLMGFSSATFTIGTALRSGPERPTSFTNECR